MNANNHRTQTDLARGGLTGDHCLCSRIRPMFLVGVVKLFAKSRRDLCRSGN
jgi:hypothetical protein